MGYNPDMEVCDLTVHHILTLNPPAERVLDKRSDEWGPSALYNSLTFPQGFNPKWSDKEEVEGGSSFNRQTLLLTASMSCLLELFHDEYQWVKRTIWILSEQETTREKGMEPMRKWWRTNAHFSTHTQNACLSIFPLQSFICSPTQQLCHTFKGVLDLPQETSTWHCSFYIDI